MGVNLTIFDFFVNSNNYVLFLELINLTICFIFIYFVMLSFVLRLWKFNNDVGIFLVEDIFGLFYKNLKALS